MRRKKQLCVLAATVMTLLSGAGPRTFAAVPPAVNWEKDADKSVKAEQKPEATVPPGQVEDQDGEQEDKDKEDSAGTQSADRPEEAESETKSVAEVPEVTEGPEETGTPEVTEGPEETGTPEVTEEPEETGTPEVTEEPEETGTPEITEEPEETGTPEVTEEPEETGTPEITEKTEETAIPKMTEKPDEPETPAPAETEKEERETVVTAPTERLPEKEDRESKETEESEQTEKTEELKKDKAAKEAGKAETKELPEKAKADSVGANRNQPVQTTVKNTEETGADREQTLPSLEPLKTEKEKEGTGENNSVSEKIREISRNEEKPELKKAPELRIDGVRDRATSQSPVELTVHIRDRDSTASGIRAVIKDTESGKMIEGRTLKNEDGYKVTFPKVSDDGHYQMTVQTKDEQGRISSEKRVAFTVNQHGGAAYLATENLAGAHINRGVSPEFVIADVDEHAGLRTTVNGHPVGASYNKEGNLILDKAITKEGRYVVRVEGKDSAGHEIRSKPVEFVIDRTKPRVWMKAKETPKGLLVNIFHDVPEDKVESLSVDGTMMAASDYTDKKGKNRILLDKEGAHTVEVTVCDDAGNKTRYTRSFRVSSRHGAKKKPGRAKTAGVVAAFFAGGAVLMALFLQRHSHLPLFRHRKQ